MHHHWSPITRRLARCEARKAPCPLQFQAPSPEAVAKTPGPPAKLTDREKRERARERARTYRQREAERRRKEQEEWLSARRMGGGYQAEDAAQEGFTAQLASSWCREEALPLLRALFRGDEQAWERAEAMLQQVGDRPGAPASVEEFQGLLAAAMDRMPSQRTPSTACPPWRPSSPSGGFWDWLVELFCGGLDAE